MNNGNNQDDGSHYEVSLTAGQAFVAFVLLLFSLAAAFAFGVIVGNGQFEEAAAAAAAETPQRTATAQQAKIVELGEPAASDRGHSAAAPYQAPVIIEEPMLTPATVTQPEIAAPDTTPQPESVPHFAQILSTTDEQAAEALARKLIDGGFPSAYVERSASPRGTVHRVRVRFPSEPEARQAVTNLRPFAAGDIWVAPTR